MSAHHGEYKVPGGKLVVVDFEQDHGSIASFRLSGDFFLEPDDVLGHINAAVEGLDAESTIDEIAAAIQRGLPEGAHLIGVTPEAIGSAVRRGPPGAGPGGGYRRRSASTGRSARRADANWRALGCELPLNPAARRPKSRHPAGTEGVRPVPGPAPTELT